ncbi:hypothetical protein CVT24_000075 [Panaeolus cyanescens]|uniref:F-box domain-containing protein n=1 Tax=Panaeolus cyanescens TaxID=181874 RepID=A0A409VST4_9AGAR|nr:hypothetical protein CVT24_000075 [Panaeolus cyanescens]
MLLEFGPSHDAHKRVPWPERWKSNFTIELPEAFIPLLQNNDPISLADRMQIQEFQQKAKHDVEQLDSQILLVKQELHRLQNARQKSKKQSFACDVILSPFRRVSLDVIYEFVAHCPLVEPHDFPPAPPFHVPSRLSHVSQAWRNAAQSTPTLWKRVAIDLGSSTPSPTLQDQIQHFYCLSGSQSFSVSAYDTISPEHTFSYYSFRELRERRETEASDTLSWLFNSSFTDLTRFGALAIHAQTNQLNLLEALQQTLSNGTAPSGLRSFAFLPRHPANKSELRLSERGNGAPDAKRILKILNKFLHLENLWLGWLYPTTFQQLFGDSPAQGNCHWTQLRVLHLGAPLNGHSQLKLLLEQVPKLEIGWFYFSEAFKSLPADPSSEITHTSMKKLAIEYRREVNLVVLFASKTSFPNLESLDLKFSAGAPPRMSSRGAPSSRSDNFSAVCSKLREICFDLSTHCADDSTLPQALLQAIKVCQSVTSLRIVVLRRNALEFLEVFRDSSQTFPSLRRVHLVVVLASGIDEWDEDLNDKWTSSIIETQRIMGGTGSTATPLQMVLDIVIPSEGKKHHVRTYYRPRRLPYPSNDFDSDEDGSDTGAQWDLDEDEYDNELEYTPSLNSDYEEQSPDESSFPEAVMKRYFHSLQKMAWDNGLDIKIGTPQVVGRDWQETDFLERYNEIVKDRKLNIFPPLIRNAPMMTSLTEERVEGDYYTDEKETFVVPESYLHSSFIPSPIDEQNIRGKVDSLNARISTVDQDIEDLRRQLKSLESARQVLSNEANLYQGVLSAVRRLPPELVQEIFLVAAEGESMTWPRRPQDPGYSMPWKLGRICSYWRTVFLSLPKLWSVINIDLTVPNSSFRTAVDTLHVGPESSVLQFLDACLQRSGNELLTISIRGTAELLLLVGSILDSLVPHSARWKDLRLGLGRLHPFRLHFAEASGRLPNLQRLNIDTFVHESIRHIDAYPDIFFDAPALQQLVISHSIQPLSTLRIPWQQLTHLHTESNDFREGEFSQMLAMSQNLISLTTKDERILELGSAEPVLLPHLKKLAVYNKGSYLAKTFKLITAPNLEDLTIHAITPFNAEPIVTMLFRSECKPTRLTLHSPSDTDTLWEQHVAIAWILSKLPEIQYLNLSVLKSDELVHKMNNHTRWTSPPLLEHLETIIFEDRACVSADGVVSMITSRIPSRVWSLDGEDSGEECDIGLGEKPTFVLRNVRLKLQKPSGPSFESSLDKLRNLAEENGVNLHIDCE